MKCPKCTNPLETTQEVDYCLARECRLGRCKYYILVSEEAEAQGVEE